VKKFQKMSSPSIECLWLHLHDTTSKGNNSPVVILQNNFIRSKVQAQPPPESIAQDMYISMLFVKYGTDKSGSNKGRYGKVRCGGLGCGLVGFVCRESRIIYSLMFHCFVSVQPRAKRLACCLSLLPFRKSSTPHCLDGMQKSVLPFAFKNARNETKTPFEWT
jgi:hypothetical protein